MTGQQRLGPDLLGSRPEQVQGAQVVGQVAVRRDHGGAAAEHGVAGEDRPVLWQPEAERVERVAWRAHHVQLQASCREHVAVAEPLLTQPVRGIQCPDGRADQPREPRGTTAVVMVPVGQQDRDDPAALQPARDPREVLLVVGAGVDDQHLLPEADHPRVGAVQGHLRGVRGEKVERVFRTRPVRPLQGDPQPAHRAPNS